MFKKVGKREKNPKKLPARDRGTLEKGKMEAGGRGRLLPALFLLPGLCLGFNVEIRNPRIFRGPARGHFGYKVLQRASGGQRWLLVGAPWDGAGDIYKCPLGAPNATCTKTNLAPRVTPIPGRTARFGMTLLETGDGGLVACAPLWSQECGTSTFSPGLCTQLDRELRPVATIAPTARRCSTYMDIVILLDGSNSIYPWHEVQSFLSNVLSRFFIGPGQIQVGVLQYGEEAVQEWPLGQFQSSEEVVEAAKGLSRREGRETRTAMAISTACTQSFSPEQGGRAGAARVLLVVTDGESHDGEELPRALAECDRRNVTRYAVANGGSHSWRSAGLGGRRPGATSAGFGSLPEEAAEPPGFHPGDPIHRQPPPGKVLQRQRRGRAQGHRGDPGGQDLQPGRHPRGQRELLPAGDGTAGNGSAQAGRGAPVRCRRCLRLGGGGAGAGGAGAAPAPPGGTETPPEPEPRGLPGLRRVLAAAGGGAAAAGGRSPPGPAQGQSHHLPVGHQQLHPGGPDPDGRADRVLLRQRGLSPGHGGGRGDRRPPGGSSHVPGGTELGDGEGLCLHCGTGSPVPRGDPAPPPQGPGLPLRLRFGRSPRPQPRRLRRRRGGGPAGGRAPRGHLHLPRGGHHPPAPLQAARGGGGVGPGAAVLREEPPRTTGPGRRGGGGGGGRGGSRGGRAAQVPADRAGGGLGVGGAGGRQRHPEELSPGGLPRRLPPGHPLLPCGHPGPQGRGHRAEVQRVPGGAPSPPSCCLRLGRPAPPPAPPPAGPGPPELSPCPLPRPGHQ